MISKTLTATFIASTFALLSTVAPSIASETQTQTYKTDVRFDWNPAQNKVTITSFTGCRSAHGTPALTSDFQVYLDHDYLQFDIQGGFLSQTNDAEEPKRIRIGSADCMGSRQEQVELQIKERETYVVNRHGYHVRDIILGDEPASFLIRDTRSHTQVKSTPAKKLPAMFLVAE